MPACTLRDLAQRLDVEFIGDPGHLLTGISSLTSASSDQVTFLRSSKYLQALAGTQAGAVILAAEHSDACPTNALIANDPQEAFIDLLELFSPERKPEQCIHPSAVIGANCDIADDVTVGANVIVESGVTLSSGVIIDAGSYIGCGVCVGEETRIFPNVTVYDGVRIGHRVRIHSSTVIGSDGFGNHRIGHSGPWRKIPQVGSVVIEDDVEIGACTAINCGALADTVIKRGAKIDSQVMIAHNVCIGENTAVAGCTGIAGSTVIGDDCLIAGACGISGNLQVTDGVVFLAGSAVSNSIKDPGVYASGTALFSASEWRRMVARLRNLDSIVKRFLRLEKKIND